MKDKILLLQSPLADFSTSPWGVLKVVDGIVILDKVKAFNRSRRFLNAGANCFRVLRHAPWAIEKEFDWEDPEYFPILKEYLATLHNPCQEPSAGQGARIVVELFDNCSEKWMYEPGNYDKARRLCRAFFAQLGDLDYVDFGSGNELNKDESTALFKNVIIPEFDKVGKIPFSYGPSYSFNAGPDLIVDHKQEASKKWGDDTSFAIYKQVHGIRDENSENRFQAVEWWARHRMCTFFSVDGIRNGASLCAFYQDKVRPASFQFMGAVKYVLNYVSAGLHPKFTLSTGQPKFAFEFISKVWNNDACGALPIMAVSELYKAKFGIWPENYGKYPDDWVELIPPAPPEPPPPGPPPPPDPEKQPWWNWWVGKNSIIAKLFRWLLGKN